MKKSKWNPYNVDITVSDMHQIAKFFKIIKNYIKINRLTTNTKNVSKQLPFAYNVSGLCVVALSRNLKLTTTLDRAITQNPCYVPLFLEL